MNGKMHEAPASSRQTVHVSVCVCDLSDKTKCCLKFIQYYSRTNNCRARLNCDWVNLPILLCSQSVFGMEEIDLCYGKFLVYCAHKMVYVSFIFLFYSLYSRAWIVVGMDASVLLALQLIFHLKSRCDKSHKLRKKIYFYY